MVVIHAVFVEQANSVLYLLCSRFISENCILPPFGEWVMECGRKQKVCHFPGFLTMPHHSAKRLSHSACHLNTGTSTMKSCDSLLFCGSDCVFEQEQEQSLEKPASLSVNFYHVTRSVC